MKQEDKEEKGKRKSAAREVLDWIIYIGIVLLLSWLIITFVGVRTVVDGRSMEPTLHDGNNLIVESCRTVSVIRNVMKSSFFRTNMKRIHIISNGLSACRERRSR